MNNDPPKKTSESRVQSPEARKKTQKIIGYGVVILVVGIAMASSFFFDKTPPATQTQTSTQGVNLPTLIKQPEVNAQDVWLGKSASDLKDVTVTAQTLSDTQKQLLERMDKLEKGGVPSQGQVSPPQNVVVEPKPLINFDRKPIHPLQQTQVIPPPPPPPAPQQSLQPAIDNQDGGQPRPGVSGMVGISMGRMIDEPAQQPVPSQGGKQPALTQRADDASNDDDVTNYIPSGSFARVTLLGGMDAPTGGQAQTQPQPILMRVDNNAILPNKFRFQVKECFVVGSGFGDISSERAYIRTESLSCILDSGETIDVAIKGYVAGEDGKTGMRGRLVSKQGQLLANALIAGIGSGIGQAFQQSAMTNSISPLGSTQTVQAGQQFQAGISTGVGKALDRLASYYIQLAEKTFPVIELDAARTVDLILTKGVTFKTKRVSHNAALDDRSNDVRVKRRENTGYYD